MSETKQLCRDKLLEEYKNANFEINSKLSTYDDGGSYLPLTEKLRMFRTDFPDGKIECSVIIDNNIFATVQCNISCSCGSASAVAKWYHNNNDAFGMNYVSTAQSNAVSSALRLLGYDAGNEKEVLPQPNYTEIELLPPPDSINLQSSINNNQVQINEGHTQSITQSNEELTFEQCRSIVINNPPFTGKTVGEILDEQFMLDDFFELMHYFDNFDCVLSPAARIIIKEAEKTNG